MEQPVKKFRAGTVSAAVWRNVIVADGKSVPVLKVTVQRRYKDKAGVWQSSGSFTRQELPLAIHCLQRAFDALASGQLLESVPLAEEEFSPPRRLG